MAAPVSSGAQLLWSPRSGTAPRQAATHSTLSKGGLWGCILVSLRSCLLSCAIASAGMAVVLLFVWRVLKSHRQKGIRVTACCTVIQAATYAAFAMEGTADGNLT